MVSLDYTVGIQIVNFLLLIVVLNVLLYKPVLGILDRRKGELERSADEIRRLQERVETQMAAYEEKLRLAKQAALEQKNELVAEGAREAKAILESARAEIPDIMERFRLQMDEEVAVAGRVLAEQSGRLSVEFAEKVLGRRLQ